MKLEFPKINVEASETFKTESFDFGDKRTIINILRAKMYSDPIRVICQEIMSNSRDAHREIGEPNKPIKVKVPTAFEESIHFIDEGPGITPDRMKNVFILYGNSTKRSDNNQTGGFGLGAKTPFSYTDSFQIVTTTQDSDGKNRREYIAYIDDSQVGALSLIKTEKVSDDTPTGTSIIVPVKREDMKRFVLEVKRTGRYWNPKPIVRGNKIEWPVETIKLNGTDWYLVESHYSMEYSEPLALVDGIPYPLTQKVLVDSAKASDKEAIKKFFNHPFRLTFNVGEVKVTANREDLDYQKDVIKLINERIVRIIDEVCKDIENKIATATSLREAIEAWENIRHVSGSLILREPRWNGLELRSSFEFNYYFTEATITNFTMDSSTEKVKAERRRWNRPSIRVKDHIALIEDDEGNDNVNVKKLRTVFKSNSEITTVTVVRLDTPNARAKIEASINWSHLSPLKLSTLAETRAVSQIKQTKGTGVARGPLIPVKELVKRHHSRGAAYEWSPLDGFDTNANGGVYVMILEGDCYRSPQKKCNKDDVYKLAQELGIKVYGVLSRQAKKLPSNWTMLEDYLRSRLDELNKDANFLLYQKHGCPSGTLDDILGGLFPYVEGKKASLDPAGLTVRFMDLTKKVADGEVNAGIVDSIRDFLGESKNIFNFDDTLENMRLEFMQDYPLIGIIKGNLSNSESFSDLLADEIITYINAKEAQKKVEEANESN